MSISLVMDSSNASSSTMLSVIYKVVMIYQSRYNKIYLSATELYTFPLQKCVPFQKSPVPLQARFSKARRSSEAAVRATCTSGMSQRAVKPASKAGQVVSVKCLSPEGSQALSAGHSSSTAKCGHEGTRTSMP